MTEGFADGSNPVPLAVGVVIPVYRGESALPSMLSELAALHQSQVTHGEGTFECPRFSWSETGARGAATTPSASWQLAAAFLDLRPVRLSRNVGQHAATLAGMTSSGGDWIITMKEDDQQDPRFIGPMLDAAYADLAQVVYARPTNRSPHEAIRKVGSRTAKRLFTRFLANAEFEDFNSYQLVLREIGRSLAAYTGTRVYVDVALSWVVIDVTTCPVTMRQEGRPVGNSSYRRLFGRFGRLVASFGTKPLVFVTFIGIAFVILGALAAIWVAYNALVSSLPVSGWASMFIALMVVGGAVMVSLGIIAQYIGATTDMSLGKPLYVVVWDPATTLRTGDTGR